jgi:hypothetical protein
MGEWDVSGVSGSLSGGCLVTNSARTVSLPDEDRLLSALDRVRR